MRVVIAEDETLLRAGLGLMLANAGFEVVGSVADATALVSLCADVRPDLVLTDVRMPPRCADDGLLAAVAIRAARPSTALVVLSQYVNRRFARELLDTGAAGVGYLLKQRVADVARFCRDLRAVGEGGTVLDPEVVTVLLSRARTTDRALTGLTPRQTDVLALVAQGRSNAAVARALGISEKSVVAHVSRIYDHLGIAVADDDHRRVLAVVRFLDR